jgi:hypothetical protein
MGVWSALCRGGKMQSEEAYGFELAEVYVAQGLLRAQVVKAKLEEAGIPVLLKYESIGPVMGITVDGLGEVHILVPSQYADEARALVEE